MPPKVWTQDKDNGGKFASINRPTSGARYDKELPIGDAPLQLYSLNTPNGVKVNILLEELAEAGISGAEYDAYKIDISQDKQSARALPGDKGKNLSNFSAKYIKIAPDSKSAIALELKPIN